MRILVAGGAGYIGSHTYVSLVEAGHEPIIVDNFTNSSRAVLNRLETITGRKPVFHNADIRDSATMEKIIVTERCDAVIHFAGLKSVGESMSDPLRYFDYNVSGSERLFTAMKNAGCTNLIFSSSATVYGTPQYLPVDEDHPLSTQSVYGQTKLVVEDMLRSLHRSSDKWAIVVLRYFNPVGAHESGLIGENPKDTPNNLMPFVTQVAVGRRKELAIFGDDYDTRDGTGVRDFIHVCDLADGHVAALDMLNKPGCTSINLGTGSGYSVLEILKTFEKVSGRQVPYRIAPRRDGDVGSCYANAFNAELLISWSAKRGIEEMCRDAWRWQSMNPQGYPDEEERPVIEAPGLADTSAFKPAGPLLPARTAAPTGRS